MSTNSERYNGLRWGRAIHVGIVNVFFIMLLGAFGGAPIGMVVLAVLAVVIGSMLGLLFVYMAEPYITSIG